MKTNYWTIEGLNEIFETLNDAKWHVEIAFTPKERVKYLQHTSIAHQVNDVLISTVAIKIDDNGAFKFGRIEKY